MTPPELTDRIERARALRPDATLALLVDPMCMLPQGLTYGQLLARGAQRVPLQGRDDISPEFHCLLVPLADGYDELLYASATWALAPDAPAWDAPAQHPVCAAIGGWLLYEACGLPGLVRHLATRMCRRDASGSRRYLRLGDPRVMQSLWRVLSAQQRHDLLGPVVQWWTASWQGQVIELERATVPAENSAGIELSANQWQVIERMAAVHSVLQQWLSEQSARRPVGAEVEVTDPLLARIDEIVLEAMALGFIERTDQVTLALAKLRGTPEKASPDAWRQVVALALETRRPLDNCLADSGLLP